MARFTFTLLMNATWWHTLDLHCSHKIVYHLLKFKFSQWNKSLKIIPFRCSYFIFPILSNGICNIARRETQYNKQNRSVILLFMTQCHKYGRLIKRSTMELMVQFNICWNNKRCVWRLRRVGVTDPSKAIDVSSKKKWKLWPNAESIKYFTS